MGNNVGWHSSQPERMEQYNLPVQAIVQAKNCDKGEENVEPLNLQIDLT